MKEFLFLFRRDINSDAMQLSPEQMQAITKPWQDWMGSLTGRGKLASRGNRLASEGRVIKPDNVVTNGPYVELKEAIGGYVTVHADDIEEATELAKGCPILTVGGTVEVRPIVDLNINDNS